MVISASFRPVSKRSLIENISGKSSEDNVETQQVATSSNIDYEGSVPSTDVTDPAQENIDDEDRTRSPAFSATIDSSTLPKEMPSYERPYFATTVVYRVCMA